MGVQFDRILDGFDGPFTKIDGLLDPPPAAVTGPANPAGWLISHKENDSFVRGQPASESEQRRLLDEERYPEHGHRRRSGCPLSRGEPDRSSRAGAKELGVGAVGLASAPAGEAMKLKPIRIGLYDQYGGLMPSGWTRWILEQFEFPFEVVYPQTLDAGDLKSKFDVLVFVDGAARLRHRRGVEAAAAEVRRSDAGRSARTVQGDDRTPHRR